MSLGSHVSGQLKKLLVNLGDQVEAGSPVAEIDPTAYAAKLLEAEANLENLKSQLRVKQAQLNLQDQKYNRYQMLISQDSVAQADIAPGAVGVEPAKASLDTTNAAARLEISVASVKPNVSQS
jgi:multidrug efflux pump subunit AcrA (membrane-fusion protein)